MVAENKSSADRVVTFEKGELVELDGGGSTIKFRQIGQRGKRTTIYVVEPKGVVVKVDGVELKRKEGGV